MLGKNNHFFRQKPQIIWEIGGILRTTAEFTYDQPAEILTESPR
jgi:hypothetical protein